MQTEQDVSSSEASTKRQEWGLFIFIVVFLFPILSVIIVSAYGFSVWVYQMFAGPPGPPG